MGGMARVGIRENGDEWGRISDKLRPYRFPYRTQIAPDLWALIPLNDEWAVWHALEYEKTATNGAASRISCGPTASRLVWEEDTLY